MGHANTRVREAVERGGGLGPPPPRLELSCPVKLCPRRWDAPGHSAGALAEQAQVRRCSHRSGVHSLRHGPEGPQSAPNSLDSARPLLRQNGRFAGARSWRRILGTRTLCWPLAHTPVRAGLHRHPHVLGHARFRWGVWRCWR